MKEFLVESVFSGDKQTSSAMLNLPRGVHVQAEAWVPESVLKSTLKVKHGLHNEMQFILPCPMIFCSD